MRALSRSQARRIALAAQGFAEAPAVGRVDVRHLRRVLGQVQLLQIDSVNVLARSHYLPLFSRLGPYPARLLDDLAYGRREVFEHWAHAASFVPVDQHPLLRPRMRRCAIPDRQEASLAAAEPGYVEAVVAEIAARGPLQASELADPGDRSGPWWGWAKGKIACEWLFAQGRLAVSARRGFTRVYDLAERVLPRGVLDAPTPTEEEADRAMLLLAARAHGVGTAGDLADYYRLKVQRARRVLDDLVREGLLEQVEVQGWDERAYLHPQARLPRQVDAAALLSPFDSLVWCRDRIERLFGFRYRLELYVPAHRRVHGYYVLPFLHGEELCARVDLKADRAAGVLRVPGVWLEDGADADATAGVLAGELERMAQWLDLDAVHVAGGGDLASALAGWVGRAG
jgi:uncharacterized protein